MSDEEPEYLLLPSSSKELKEYLDWIDWMHDEIRRQMIETCRIPKELFFGGKTEETKAKKA